MNGGSISWSKVSFADLSGLDGIIYYAFSSNDEIISVQKIENEDPFTKITIALSIQNIELDKLDIWVGEHANNSEKSSIQFWDADSKDSSGLSLLKKSVCC